MARKSRIEINGYYDVINRGVAQRVVFKEAVDYEYFEEMFNNVKELKKERNQKILHAYQQGYS